MLLSLCPRHVHVYLDAQRVPIDMAPRCVPIEVPMAPRMSPCSILVRPTQDAAPGGHEHSRALDGLSSVGRQRVLYNNNTPQSPRLVGRCWVYKVVTTNMIDG